MVNLATAPSKVFVHSIRVSDERPLFMLSFIFVGKQAQLWGNVCILRNILSKALCLALEESVFMLDWNV
jgi:hypothetical protein